MTNEDYMTEFFGEPISICTDADALSDGTLVDISSLKLAFESKPVNRMTANLFWTMQPDYPMNDEQLEELFKDCETSDDDPVNFDMQAFAKDLAKKLTKATGEGRIRNLLPDIWIVENEDNGWTLMKPSGAP